MKEETIFSPCSKFNILMKNMKLKQKYGLGY